MIILLLLEKYYEEHLTYFTILYLQAILISYNEGLKYQE